jgi:hypothetical protein
VSTDSGRQRGDCSRQDRRVLGYPQSRAFAELLIDCEGGSDVRRSAHLLESDRALRRTSRVARDLIARWEHELRFRREMWTRTPIPEGRAREQQPLRSLGYELRFRNVLWPIPSGGGPFLPLKQTGLRPEAGGRRRASNLLSHHVEDRLLPLKQTAHHPLDPPSTLLMRRPNEDGPCQISLMAQIAMASSYRVQVPGPGTRPPEVQAARRAGRSRLRPRICDSCSRDWRRPT